MKIEWTEKAINKISDKINGKQGHMTLNYDTDGCGCVMSGVTNLSYTDSHKQDHEKIETNFLPVYLEKTKMIFLDETMKIDFVPEANSFQLKSPNGILNPRMSFFDRTQA
ncbi:iron-sulfur cluster biosynthesis family protein [Peribacillus glennii]|uniref:Iron-sulfur cluster biosynthesis family protein n=1 Tax=Peribacillus glennii TaxID=2303991 RepID=A0A372LH40_9BACI|nr:iron-sulfur cluster biosynthesis family protein [Peribacillus glennii]RFU65618.1 iron-sulfur cluster biosynthesis family protein [Peribacillus glennii]